MAQNGGLRPSPYRVFLHEWCRYPGLERDPPGRGGANVAALSIREEALTQRAAVNQRVLDGRLDGVGELST